MRPHPSTVPVMNHTQLLLPDGCIFPAGGHHGHHTPPRAASATHVPRGSQRAPCLALASLRGCSRRCMSAVTFKRQRRNGFTMYVTPSGRRGPRPPRALPSETDRTNPEGGHCSLSPSTELSTGSVPAQEGLSTQKCPRFSSFKGTLLGQRTQGRALGMLGRHELSLSRPRRGPGWSAAVTVQPGKGRGLLRARQGRQAHQGGTGGGSVVAFVAAVLPLTFVLWRPVAQIKGAPGRRPGPGCRWGGSIQQKKLRRPEPSPQGGDARPAHQFSIRASVIYMVLPLLLLVKVRASGDWD